MSDFRNFLNKQLEDPEFKAEWEALQPELSLVQAMIDARKVSGLTQKELSERTGIAQAYLWMDRSDRILQYLLES